jgi:RNA polymerase sigma factor (sigma-70 family)
MIQKLTPRQRQILELIAKGKQNKEIAVCLGISENTVEQHIRKIYKTLNVDNRVEASLAFNGLHSKDDP